MKQLSSIIALVLFVMALMSIDAFAVSVVLMLIAVFFLFISILLPSKK